MGEESCLTLSFRVGGPLLEVLQYQGNPRSVRVQAPGADHVRKICLTFWIPCGIVSDVKLIRTEVCIVLYHVEYQRYIYKWGD